MHKTNSKSVWKIFFIVFSLFLAETFVLKQKVALGWSFDFLLAIVFVSPIFLNLSEFLFFEIFIIWFFRLMYPFSGAEIVLISVLPALLFFFKFLFSLQSWIEPFAAAFFGIFIFYALTARTAGLTAFLFLNIAVSLVFSWVFYLAMRYIFLSKNRTYEKF